MIGLEQSNAYDNGPKVIYMDRQDCEKELISGLRNSDHQWIIDPTEIGIFGRWKDESYGKGMVLTKYCVGIESTDMISR